MLTKNSLLRTALFLAEVGHINSQALHDSLQNSAQPRSKAIPLLEDGGGEVGTPVPIR